MYREIGAAAALIDFIKPSSNTIHGAVRSAECTRERERSSGKVLFGILAFWQGWKTERRCRASWRQVASVFGTGSSLIGLVQGMVPSSKPAALHFPLPPLPPPTNPHPPTITLLISAKLVKDIRMFETKLEYFSGSDRY